MERIIRKYLRCWEHSVVMMKEPGILLPFIVVAFGQIVVLLALTYFSKWPISYFMVDLVRLLGGDKVINYPAHYVSLPYMYRIASLPFMMTIGFIMFGWAVYMMSDYYDGVYFSFRSYAGKIAWQSPALVIIGIVFFAASVVVPLLISVEAGDVQNVFWKNTLLRTSRLVGLLAAVSFIYSPLFLKLYQQGPLEALRISIRFARKRLLLTIMILLTAVVIHKPFSYIEDHSYNLALKFKPEIIFFALMAGILISVFTNYFMFAATTYLAAGKKR